MQQFSDVDYLIIQEGKQILMSKSYGHRGNLSLELLCISMTLELFKGILNWCTEWFDNPEGLYSYDIDGFVTLGKEKWKKHHITN